MMMGLIAVAAITAFAQSDPAAVSPEVLRWDAALAKQDRNGLYTENSNAMAIDRFRGNHSN